MVFRADFASAIRELVPDNLRRRWSDSRIDGKSYSCSTFMLYLGLRGALRPRPPHHLPSSRYEENIARSRTATRAPDAAVHLRRQSRRTDPAFAPGGRSSLYVLAPVGHCGKIDWTREAGPFRDLVLTAWRAFGFHGLRERIRYEKRVTPEDWRDDMGHPPRGDLQPLARARPDALFRPHNRFEDVDGLYLVGGGTHPGSGLPVIYEGARITTDLLLKDLGLARLAREREGLRSRPDRRPPPKPWLEGRRVMGVKLR